VSGQYRSVKSRLRIPDDVHPRPAHGASISLVGTVQLHEVTLRVSVDRLVSKRACRGYRPPPRCLVDAVQRRRRNERSVHTISAADFSRVPS
jgi:hypothetical protein